MQIDRKDARFLGMVLARNRRGLELTDQRLECSSILGHRAQSLSRKEVVTKKALHSGFWVEYLILDVPNSDTEANSNRTVFLQDKTLRPLPYTIFQNSGCLV